MASIVKTWLSFDSGKTKTEVHFPGETCRDGMDILLAIEKKAGGPPSIDERWNALQAQTLEEKNANKRTSR